MTILFFNRVATATTGAVILFALFILMCYTMLVFLSYRFRIIVMTAKEFIIIVPFRFKRQSFRFDNVKYIKWNLWESNKTGDYRKLCIQTSSGYRTSISDLEFMNFDTLEAWLISRTDLKLNLNRKLSIELQQAKRNRWINIMVIVMILYFFFQFSNGQLSTDILFPIQVVMFITTWRLLVRLIQYQKTINKS